MSVAAVRRLVSFRSLSAFTVALLLVAGLLHIGTVYGEQLPSRSIELGTAVAGATDHYKLSFNIPNAETLGSIRLQFCAESPLIGQPCSLPAGMDLSGAVLDSQVPGASGFSILSVSGTDMVLTRPASPIGIGQLSFEFAGIVNPSGEGSYFGRIQTYSSATGTGVSTDYGGLAFSITTAVQISAVVPPYLYFCVGIVVSGTDCTTATGDYINFGNFVPSTTSVAQTQMVAGTNADTGYVIVVNGNTLTSGNNVLPALATSDISRPGVAQFGMNLVANNDPQVGQAPFGSGHGVPVSGYNATNSYKFVSGSTVAAATLPDEARKYTTSYIANVAKTQAPGIYVTTLTYVATGGF